MPNEQHIQSVMGRNLMILRKAHDLTQEQVAKILKIKRSTYAYYERDITPTIENIKKLATLFNVSVHFLMYGENDNISSDGLLLEGTDNDVERMKLRDLRKEEAPLLGFFRLLTPQNKEKILKEVQDLYEKAN